MMLASSTNKDEANMATAVTVAQDSIDLFLVFSFFFLFWVVLLASVCVFSYPAG
jgi:hypothetical protein